MMLTSGIQMKALDSKTYSTCMSFIHEDDVLQRRIQVHVQGDLNTHSFQLKDHFGYARQVFPTPSCPM